MKSTRRSHSAASQQSSDPQSHSTGGAGRSNAELQERLRQRAAKPTRVSDAKALQTALRGAKAGDWIQLDDGLYQGQFSMNNVRGTANAPVRVEGSSNAVVEGFTGKPGKPARSDSDIAKTTLTLNKVEHAHLSGFTILGGQRGLILNGCNHNTMDGLTVKNTIAEAVHFKESSAYNTLQNSHIKDAGMGRAAPWLPDKAAKGQPSKEKFRGNGEGVYIGTDSKKWGRDGKDDSHSNRILNNYIEGTTAEHIDIKDGVRKTLIQGNHFIADDRFSGDNGAESMVDVKGSDNTVRDNAFVNRSGASIKGWHVTRRGNKDAKSGTDNTFSGNRFTGTTSKGLFDNQSGDGDKWEKSNTVRDDFSQKAQQISVSEWSKGRSSPASHGPSNEPARPSSKPQRPGTEWRKPMGRWDPARTIRRARLFESPGKAARTLEQGEAIWVREDSQDNVQLDNTIQPSRRVMVDDDGKGSDEKGRVVAEALPSRFQSGGNGPGKGAASGTGKGTDKGGLAAIPAPADASKKDHAFPAGIADMLLKKTGLDSEQWDNIADLIGKSEHNMGKGWKSDTGLFYGSCEKLDYDKDTRGTTITAFGATTGKGYNDAKRLFKEYGTSAEDLGLGNFQRFKKNIGKLADNPKWQQAVWRWFHSEYVAPSVSQLEGLGFTSALTVAAVTDCALNQGYSGDHGAKKLMGIAQGAKSEEAFLRRFLDARAKVADKNGYNANGNGARRVGMYRKLLDRGQLDLRDKNEVRDAMKWKMH